MGCDSGALLAAIGGFARPAGSAAEAQARSTCAQLLREGGFDVEERPFTFSAFPGMWGQPLAGAALITIGLATAITIGRGGAIGAASARALVGLAAVAIAGRWLGSRGTIAVPFMRRTSVNLEARRRVVGGDGSVEPPAVWLTAHIDSKSQPVSLLVRAAAVVAVSMAWGLELLAWGLSQVTYVEPAVPIVLSACAAVAAVPFLASWIGTGSAGALDNATGVASIVSAALHPDAPARLGLVLTSAEEYGLAGARAWVEGKAVAFAINCDGVDDRGRMTITGGSAGREVLRSEGVAGILGPDVRIRRALPGILLDSTAFSDRGWPAWTVSRGTLRSLARVHTRRDTLDSLSGGGIERAANLIARLAGAIIAGGCSSEFRKGGSEAHGTATSER